jgi:2-oxoglutarate/2-oxoacid ferredoxin oxidoreductase subunit alpha
VSFLHTKYKSSLIIINSGIKDKFKYNFIFLLKMRLNILIGGKAGQGINKISGIVSSILVKKGYFTFNYRDYPSVIRGSHNFNVLSISDEKIGSIESKVDVIIPMDDRTIKTHKKELRAGGVIVDYKKFVSLGRNINIALAGVLIKLLGIEKELLIEEIRKSFGEDAIKAGELGFKSSEKKFEISGMNNKLSIMSGSMAIAEGAIRTGIDIYLGYPMTPSTGLLHALAGQQMKYGYMVFQPENEIAVVNSALGASYAGARVMIGTSGGGFDLMAEGLSLQGSSEVPLVVYLASRPGPATGVPTYSTQGDLDLALRSGHGEFPRVVVAPGDPIECIEKTNELFYLSEKFKVLSILLGDKHLAESEFSFDRKPNEKISVKVVRKVPGEPGVVKASSYEHDEHGNTTENAAIAKKNAERRLQKYESIREECKKFQMVKRYGNMRAKNLIIGWGSTKTVILDAMDAIDGSVKNGKGDYKFLQVLYIKPLSDEIRKEIESAGKVILIENNLTGQLGRLIREKTGIAIRNRILKYDTRPFRSDELKEEILRV